jgi:protein TonB
VTGSRPDVFTASVDKPAATAPSAAVPAGANKPRDHNRTLSVAIGLSVMAHAALLLVKFVAPPPRALENLATPLEVVLVNSKAAHKPTRADALAQADLDGGGNTEARRRARSNLPAVDDSTELDAAAQAAQRVEKLEAEMRRLLTRVKAMPVADPVGDAFQAVPRTDDPVARAQAEQQALRIARLEAEISREWDQYQTLPRRKFIGARTESVVYAQYVDEWRQRIERVGTHNFPEEAKRQGLYASLLITVSIRADGSVERVDIDRSSGVALLDRAARRIVELASPFPPFPPAIRSRYDVISITRNWTFTRAQELVSE